MAAQDPSATISILMLSLPLLINLPQHHDLRCSIPTTPHITAWSSFVTAKTVNNQSLQSRDHSESPNIFTDMFTKLQDSLKECTSSSKRTKLRLEVIEKSQQLRKMKKRDFSLRNSIDDSAKRLSKRYPSRYFQAPNWSATTYMRTTSIISAPYWRGKSLSLINVTI